MKAAAAEGVGECAPGVSEKIQTASEAAFDDITKATTR